MFVRHSMAFVRLAFALVALTGSATATLGATAPDPISTDPRADLRRLARLAAETPGPWRQVPHSSASGPGLGTSLKLSGEALSALHGFAPPTMRSFTDSEPGPDLWQPGFGLPSINEYPSVAIEFRGDLVVSGWVRSAGGTKVNGIARWTGASWEPLGDGIVPAFTLVVHGDRLLAGSWTGEVSSWDGAKWTSLPKPHVDRLDALLEQGDTLFLAGTRYPNTGVVMRFDGTSWTNVGGTFDASVLRLGTFQGQLIAGGQFGTCDGAPCRYVARFDGTHWSALGAGIDETPYAAVQAIQEFDGRLVVGGSFLSCSGEPTCGLASFDGTSWHALPGDPSGLVYDLMIADRQLWVAGYLYGPGGYSSVQAFDGSIWNASLEPLSAWTLGLATWRGRVVAAGGFDEAGSYGRERGRTSLAVLGADGWEGLENWNDQQNGLALNCGAAWVQSIVDFHGDLVVSGLIRLAGSANGWKPLRGVARWDGREWSPLGNQILCSMGYLAVVGDGLVMAGSLSGTSPEGPLIGAARWDGTAWHPMGAFWEGLVASVCEYAGHVYVGGESIRLPSGETTTLARWDGTAWQAVAGAPSEPTYNMARVEALLVVGDRLVVGGNFNRAGGLSCGGVAEWDGQGWSALGDGPGGEVAALALHHGTLYAGGMMSGAAPFQTEGVKRWTGREWIGLGLENTQVTALASYGDRLVIAGLSGTDRFVPGSLGLVAFDGTQWTGFGTGLTGEPWALHQWGGDLVVGGGFDHAGSVPAYGIARWAGGEPAPPPLTAPVSRLSLSASPLTASETHVRYQLPSAGRVRIEAYDLAGARVATLLDRVDDAGGHDFVWSAGQPAALPRQGVYFLRLRFEQFETVSKLVIAR